MKGAAHPCCLFVAACLFAFAQPVESVIPAHAGESNLPEGRLRQIISEAEQSLADCEKRLADCEKRYGGFAAETLRAKFELANLYAHAGRLEAAWKLFSECVAYWQENGSRSPLQLARALNGLAAVEATMGRYRDALAHYEETLKVIEKHLAHPGNSATFDELIIVAVSYDGMGTALSALAKYHEAIGKYKTAYTSWKEEVARASRNDTQRAEAELGFYRTCLKLATAYELQGCDKITIGRRSVPIRFYCQVLVEKVENRFGLGHANLVDFYNVLADLHIRRSKQNGDQDILCLAEYYSEESKRICREQGNVAGELNAGFHLAVIDYRLGFTSDAQRKLKELLTLCMSYHLESRVGQIQRRLADDCYQRGDLAEAERLYRKSLVTLEKAGALPVARFNTSFGLALTLDKRGKPAEAVSCLKHAIRIIEVAAAATTGAERHRARFYAYFVSAYDLLLKLLVQQGDLVEAISYAEKLRGGTLIDELQLSGVDLLSTLPEPTRGQLKRQWDDLLRRHDELLSEMSRDTAGGDAVVELRALEGQISTLWEEIRDASPIYRRLLGTTQRFGDFQVLLKHFRGELSRHGQMALYYYLGDTESYLFVIVNGKLFHRRLTILPENANQVFVNLGPNPGPIPLTRPLARRLVERYLVALKHGWSSNPLNNRGFREQVGVKEIFDRKPEITMGGQVMTLKRFDTRQAIALSETLLPRGILEQMKSCRQVTIIPDGALHRLPFQALAIAPFPDPQQPRRYLIDIERLPPISYGPSLRVLALLRDRDQRQQRGQEIILLGGNLPGSIEEIQSVAGCFSFTQAVIIAPWDRDVASEPLLRRHAAESRILLIAGHAVCDKRNNSCGGYIPMYAGKGEPQDGRLELHEIYNLNLRGCEIVVLSACETYLGSPRYLEIDNSLARAFLVAGSARVVASFWRVNDKSTAQLMSRFFQRVADEMEHRRPIDYAAALHAAMLELRNGPDSDWRAPYYWAPFALIGPIRKVEL